MFSILYIKPMYAVELVADLPFMLSYERRPMNIQSARTWPSFSQYTCTPGAPDIWRDVPLPVIHGTSPLHPLDFVTVKMMFDLAQLMKSWFSYAFLNMSQKWHPFDIVHTATNGVPVFLAFSSADSQSSLQAQSLTDYLGSAASIESLTKPDNHQSPIGQSSAVNN